MTHISAGRPLTILGTLNAWMATVDFGAVIEEGTCTEGLTLACQGNVELTCAADGSVDSMETCPSFCERGTGCVDTLIVEPDTQAWRAIRNDVAAGSRPSFEWTVAP